jgi:hypothetical protein
MDPEPLCLCPWEIADQLYIAKFISQRHDIMSALMLANMNDARNGNRWLLNSYSDHHH